LLGVGEGVSVGRRWWWWLGVEGGLLAPGNGDGAGGVCVG
jgi:hypothetical protein